jgi:MtrB/PioB family decaheme-associated outer membrane protein
MRYAARYWLCLSILGASTVHADESTPEWQELVTPASRLELGLGLAEGVTPLFANAAGSQPGRAHLIAGFDLHGGAAYDSAAGGRWRLSAERLGLESRELRGNYAEPGQYGLAFHVDRVERAAAEGYRTPFLGAGSDTLYLPDGLARASSDPVTGAAALEEAMHRVEIGSTRRRAGFSAHLRLAPHWEIRTDLREDRQTGSRASGATLGTGGSSIGMILPEPVDSVTRAIETSLGYQETGRHLHLGYRGSFFMNEIDGYRFQSPFAIANTLLDNRMGSAPDNQAHQISLNGGYNFSRNARLTGTASYGRLTQNDPFLAYSTAPGVPALPRDSLDGEVVTRQAQVRWVSRPARNFRLNAGYKLDSRDNRTPVDAYLLPGVSIAALGEVGAANYSASNTPYSREMRQGQIEAGYAPRAGSDLMLTLQRESMRRDCHGDSECVEVPETEDDTWRIDWRQDIAPGVSGRIGLGVGARRGDDYQRFAESVELAGMRKFFLADRRRNQLRAGLNAEFSESVSLGMSLDTQNDRYEHSPYGLQAADSGSLHLDLGYVVDADLSLGLFTGRERYRSRLAGSYASTVAQSGVTAELPGGQWQAHMDDDIDTLGVNLKHKGLLSGRLEFDADLVMLRSRSPYRIVGGPASASATAALPPEALPVVRSQVVEARLGARYALDEQASLRLGYLYRRLSGADFALDLYSSASLNRLLRSDETTPRHSAHILGLSYQHSFR